MAAASFAQSNFLGGEWSLSHQGRVDHPNYKKAMAKCRNSYPAAEGCLVRRPGFRFIATTRSGAAGRVLPFQFANETPYNIELTDGHMRFFNGPSLVFNNDSKAITAFSTANPGVATTTVDHGWTTGTQIQFLDDASAYPDKFAILRNRQFAVTSLTNNTFKVADPVSGAFLDGNTVNADFTHANLTAKSVLDVITPWTGTQWDSVRLVQAPNNNVLLHGSVAPRQLTLTPTADTTIATATLATANILDGPYLDVDTTGAYLNPFLADVTKPNIVSFIISFPAYNANKSYNKGALVVDVNVAYRSLIDDNLGNTPASSAADWVVVDAGVINGDGGFTSADIGRCMRFLSEPPAWVAGTTYAVGAPVKYDSVYYKSLAAGNVGNTPDKSVDMWIPTTDTAVARWTWGRITAVGSGASPRFICEIIGTDSMLYTTITAGDTFVFTFRMGLYGSPGVGWPSSGVYHQGRLWLGGAQANRIDSSKSNDFFNFAPTGADGTVADNNAISATFNSNEINQIYWMVTSGQGILCGTKGGEWVVQASALNDPISPTNIQANEVTHYGCANILPIKTGMATVFVQKYQRKCMELLTDVFSGKYSAPDLSEAAKHFTGGAIAELAYQEELAPIIWVRSGGALYGITYRRNSPFITDAASFSAWHRHPVTTTDLVVESICTGPSSDADQTIDVLSAVIHDTVAGARHVVTMAAPIDEDSSLYESFFLDQAHAPSFCLQSTVNSVAGLTAYGLHYLEGQSVDVWSCGLDLGTYTVSGGSIFVPFGSDSGGLFTLAFSQSLTSTTNLYGNQISRQSAGAGASPFWFPFLVGKTYTSQHQLLRPSTAEEAGSRNGPPFAKTRRAHQGALQLVNCVTGSIETGIQDTNRTLESTYRMQTFRTQGNTAYDALTLFNGIHWFMLDDDYNFDSMLAWRVTRPYPMTVCQAGAFLHTQDK